MHFKKGNDRVVVILPMLGIVLKFPIIHLWRFIYSFLRCFTDREYFVVRLRMGIKGPISYPFSFRGMLFKGLHANWCEFWFYFRTRNIFLQPTYISFFGLLNIQRIGEPCLMEPEDVWCQLSRMNETLRRDLWKDSHHFANPDNFCFYKGKFRMLDYGSKASREVVKLHGAYIVENFDPAYSWEEVKKRLVSQQERREN